MTGGDDKLGDDSGWLSSGASRGGRSSENQFDDFFCHVVGDAEIGPGDRHEAEDDSRRLGDLAAVGPLHALQLGPTGAKEGQRAVAPAQRSPRGTSAIAAPAPMAELSF